MSTRGIAKSAVVIGLGVVAVLAVALFSPAGPLEPTAPPAGTMHTLDEIYANTASVIVPPEVLAKARGKAYMQIGILGESTDADHLNWIDIFGMSYKEENSSTIGTAGKVNFSNLTVVKELDRSSPKLALTCASGQHIKQVLIQCMTSDPATPKKYYEITLTEAFVTGVTPKMVYRGNGFIFMEEISFGFSKIEWNYYRYDEAGNLKDKVPAWWDLSINKGG
jgi:type VI secretion system secreted protein Hcp